MLWHRIVLSQLMKGVEPNGEKIHYIKTKTGAFTYSPVFSGFSGRWRFNCNIYQSGVPA